MAEVKAKQSVKERFANGEIVMIAEGYTTKLEERGYIEAGAWVPEVVLEHPDLIKQQYEEFVHAGSDVIVAFTYFASKEKLRMIGREDDVQKLNETALRLAKEVAEGKDVLVAGDIGNTTFYDKDDPENASVKEMFRDQVVWAVDHKVDLIVGETFYDFGEAMLCVEAINKYGKGVPYIIQMTPQADDKTRDGILMTEALQNLEAAGATAVGLNCNRGPDTMLPLLKTCREAVKGPLGCVPVPYRTTEKEPLWFDLTYPGSDERVYTTGNLDIYKCGRRQMAEFGAKAKEIGANYLGICCGNTAAHFRAMCEGIGKKVPASRFSPDFSKHFFYGDKEKTNSKYSTAEILSKAT